MLRLILGRSGSGKSQYILNKACEVMKNGGQAVLVVPEQYTFESERSILRLAGPKSGLHIEVLSFSRMVHRVFGQYGGLAVHTIDECGKYILMQRAMMQISDLLGIYAKQTRFPAFIKTMTDMVSEYKMSGVDPEKLEEAGKKTDDARLKKKLADLSLIMRSYDAMLANGYADPTDDLTRLCESLKEHPFFEGKTVLIDEFKGFTAQEKALLEQIIRQADEVEVTLCADALSDEEHGFGLFSPVKKTARELIALAGKAGVSVARPAVLTEIGRFQKDELIELERRVFRRETEPFEEPAPAVHLVSASNIYDEAQFAAQEIARLVREEGVRYRDIVVISRGLERYRGILDPVFHKYGVPLFMDTSRTIETHPLMTLLLCLLDMITENFRIEHVFRYLKTGLAGFDTVEISLLENYVYTWNIRGREAWYTPWTGNPEGFSDGFTDSAAARLSKINGIRERFVQPLRELENALQAAQGAQEMLRALYRYLSSIGAEGAVTSRLNGLMQEGETELADEYRQIWEKLIHIFDQAAFTLKDEAVTFRQLSELLHLSVANSELAHIPPSLDEVTAGDAERIRSGGVRIAFVIGLAEGIFPKTQAAGGILTDAEREKLISLGLELSPPAQQRMLEERFIAYKALTGASESIYLTYPRSDTQGHVMRPSHFWLHIKNLMPHCDLRQEALSNELDTVQNELSAFELLAADYQKNTPLERSLKSYFAGLPQYEEKLLALSAAAHRKAAAIRGKDTARELFGDRMHISPSRMESYEQCPFLYFCRYGMRARPRTKAELAAPQIGTLIHFVLERLLSSQKGKKLWEIGRETLEEMVDRLLDEFAAIYLGGLDDKAERFKYLFLRLKETAVALVLHIAEELSESDFYPVDFELSIRQDAEVPPVVLDLPDGGAIAVEGTVDRVDLMEKNGKSYLRVIDYKTGSKTFSLSDVLYGLNLQMFIYLFTLCRNGEDRYGASQIQPAGVLYLPARRPDLSAQRGTAEETVKKELLSEMRMSGLVADDPEVILGMERQGKGLFIPAKPGLKSSVASFEQLGSLKRHIEGTLRAMAASLREGGIAAVPVRGLGYDPCSYCEYHSVCGHEKDDPVRYLKKFDTDKVWDKLKGEDDNA